jgi:hypothetical protein
MHESKILSIKIDYFLGEKNVIDRLYEMLSKTTEEEKIMKMHYELWKMLANLEAKKANAEEHHQKALELCRKLHEKIPEKYDYIQILEELTHE